MYKDIYCRFLINGLSFHQLNIRFCTTLQQGQIISTYQKNPIECAQKIIEKRQKIIYNFRQGIAPESCEGCIYKDTNIGLNFKISVIDLYYWYHCNCGCFYCSYRDVTKGEFSDKIKEGNPVIYKIIKELYKHDMIDTKNLLVRFGGGELGVLKEFPKLVDLFLKNNVYLVLCESSGIRYSKALEKLFKKGKARICVAVCTGNRDIYKKIKKRDKYLQVMKNLQKYVNAAKKFKQYKYDTSNVNNVISKFIILEGFNNTKEALDEWLLESQKYGLTTVEISMEYCWGVKAKAGKKVEEYNYELFDYAKKRSKQLRMNLIENRISLSLMEKGVY